MTNPPQTSNERRKASTPSWRVRLVLVLVSLVLGIVVCEVALRLTWENLYRHELPDHLIRLRIHHPFKDDPGDRTLIDPDLPPVEFHTDERSYILPSKRFEDPDATITFLGASTTECYAVQEDLRFHALVSKLLEERGIRVNTLNLARSANSTHDSINVLFNHALEDKPDVVVMMHATADVALLAQYGSYRTRSGAPATYRTALRWLLQSASARSSLVGAIRKMTERNKAPGPGGERATKPREFVHLDTSLFVSRLRAFIGIARAFGVEPVLMTQPLISIPVRLKPEYTNVRNQEIFNDLIRKVGREEGILVIDLARHLIEDVPDWDKDMYLFYDGIHVTDAGSKIYGEYIAQRLLETILKPLAEGDREGWRAWRESLRDRPLSGLPADHDEEASLPASLEGHPQLDE